MTMMDCPTSEQINDATQTLIRAMQADPYLAWAWHCNMAIVIQDAGVSYNMSNAGVARLMKVIFNVDTSKAPMPEDDEVDWR